MRSPLFNESICLILCFCHRVDRGSTHDPRSKSIKADTSLLSSLFPPINPFATKHFTKSFDGREGERHGHVERSSSLRILAEKED